MEKVNMDEDTPDHTSSDRHEGFSNVAGMELEIEEDNLDDIPDELIEEEEELSLEDLIQELEATTRMMNDKDLLDNLAQKPEGTDTSAGTGNISNE